MEHTSTRSLIDDASQRVRSLREGKTFWGVACAFLFGTSVVKKDSGISAFLALACVWFCYCCSERADAIEKSIESLKRAEEEGDDEAAERISRWLEQATNASFISIVRGVF